MKNYDWSLFSAPKPNMIGVKSYDVSDRASVIAYFDWKALFKKWEFPHSFPSILDNIIWRESAENLQREALRILSELLDLKTIKPQAIFGVWPAYRDNSTVFVNGETAICFEAIGTDDDGYCPAKFIKPKDAMMPGETDYIGGFAITLGNGINDKIKELHKSNSEYEEFLTTDVCALYLNAIAMFLHYRVRRVEWGYCKDDDLSNDEFVLDLQQGIQIVIGQEEAPDQTLRVKLSSLLVDVCKPPNFADPEFASLFSLAGFYFGHPKSRRNSTSPTQA